jgi:hypothetical protein
VRIMKKGCYLLVVFFKISFKKWLLRNNQLIMLKIMQGI